LTCELIQIFVYSLLRSFERNPIDSEITKRVIHQDRVLDRAVRSQTRRVQDETRQAHLAAPESVGRVFLRDAQVRSPEANQVPLRVVRGFSGVRALEVDHIVPRSRGGTDDPDNLQALCYRCNAMKRDRDDTDFRGMAESYERREQGCPFCEMPKDRAVGETELAYAIRDAFPVTSLHTVLIPKRHVRGYFELGRSELNACQRLLEQEKKAIEQADPSVEGFNVGVNEGEVAGQTIFHCHIHLVPRRKGDVEDPTGGVRHVLPGKGDYRR
jgi:diadenosine tetraphosphate (Ap4A) HIT family hydrolase/5-methylcytosine-specific restriction endonuclease McrA